MKDGRDQVRVATARRRPGAGRMFGCGSLEGWSHLDGLKIRCGFNAETVEMRVGTLSGGLITYWRQCRPLLVEAGPLLKTALVIYRECTDPYWLQEMPSGYDADVQRVSRWRGALGSLPPLKAHGARTGRGTSGVGSLCGHGRQPLASGSPCAPGVMVAQWNAQPSQVQTG
jgi:hypothetical protein